MTTSSNGYQHSVATSDPIAEDPPHETPADFYDLNNPELQPPVEVNSKKKRLGRRLLGWIVVLFLLGGAALALYLLLRERRVNVQVQAGSRSEDGGSKSKPDAGSEQNGLTAEAINIARSAGGVDVSTGLGPASPVVSPVASQGAGAAQNLSHTANSPVFAPVVDPGTSVIDSQPQPVSPSQPANPEAGSRPVPQSRANLTRSIYVEDLPHGLMVQAAYQTAKNRSGPDVRSVPIEKPKAPPAVLPPFGTMLPVRTQGVIFSLRNNSYARLELTRDTSGEGWFLPKGTLLIGRTSGSEYDRAFVSVIGYIDPRDNRLVKMSGDLLGADGAAGIAGKRIRVDRNRIKTTLRKVASGGVQVAGMMAGALGRGPVVIDGAGYRMINPITDEARSAVGESSTFVKVQAGQPGLVMVADLPAGLHTVDAPGTTDLDTERAASSLTDREVMELILFGTSEEIRAAMPMMNEEQKRLVTRTYPMEEKK